MINRATFYLSKSVPVSTVSYIYCDIMLCTFSTNTSHSVESSVVHDTNLTDGDYLSCVDFANSSATSITIRLSRKNGPFVMPMEILVSGQDLDCSPGGGVIVLASVLCRSAPCGHMNLCTKLRTFRGAACRFRCCENRQACETFFLHLTLKAYHRRTLCEVTVIY